MIKNDGRPRTCGHKRKCGTQVGTFYACSEEGCGREYPRCDEHGGIEAGRRSLTAHKGLCYRRAERLAREGRRS